MLEGRAYHSVAKRKFRAYASLQLLITKELASIKIIFGRIMSGWAFGEAFVYSNWRIFGGNMTVIYPRFLNRMERQSLFIHPFYMHVCVL